MRTLYIDHSNREYYFEVPSDTILHKTCLIILNKYVENGYFNYDKPNIFKSVGVTEHEINNLNSKMKELIHSSDKYQLYKNYLNLYESKMAVKNKIEELKNIPLDPSHPDIVNQTAYKLLEKYTTQFINIINTASDKPEDFIL